MATSSTYTHDFYDTIAAGSIASADVVVPLVLADYDIDTVADIGCGRGWWGAAFADRGCTVTGVDGAYVTDPVIPFVACDIATEQLPAIGPVDLAICLEVAEHVPQSAADDLVAGLCALSDRVLFSAAIPGQTGAGHINCQWPSFWSALFARHGYGAVDTLRWRIWDDNLVEPWYRQNLLIFERGVKNGPPPAVVHPVIWGWRQ